MPRTDSAPQGTHGVFGSARSWFGPNKPPPFTLIDFNVQNLFPIRLTLARDALLPSRVGIRKDVVLLDLIRMRAKADLTLPDGRFIYGFSCKDTIFNGQFSVNIPAKALEYRKRIGLPNGLYLSANAGVQHVGTSLRQSVREQFRPFLGAHLQLGGSASNDDVVFGGAGGLSWKQRIPVPMKLAGLRAPRAAVEAYTNVKLPSLTTLQSLDGDNAFEQPYGLQAESGQALTVHIDHYNLVFEL
ncbi:hypothetical protein ACKKBG_A06235 [Auxenochlorella protothecoides x Auxenochlorella symbiontica]|uniref:Uncharacterized protein n=2 Tax=Auxenochlorella protothecoides TaxID=3075 RepID=A0A087SSE8_AUXPR|nr:hypothetical protein F751_0809 [Auxenochlorella protothecoides]KFM28652.1 hypothetical protein F751_0809 [Auxenochlorella protothecoides]RMZ55578.1 hypothetical protein APUTEX25_000161 [Auxenochlorella protothecoides]|eukprot:RMZ55578.1 hypothetical protein APUTEX25_000161 [Auxenochlorella protothecoides]